jgi:hypothetical protein
MLQQAQRTIADVRAFREQEMRRFWPAVWRRWAVAVVFALAAATAFGSGYAWASHPNEAELVALRSRLELPDAVAQRVLTMTPTERRQLDALLKWNVPPSRMSQGGPSHLYASPTFLRSPWILSRVRDPQLDT